jgi:DNA invertase Pin-like site-specific DNA recombinase
MKVAIYVRVSTNEQTTENQIRELTDWAGRAGHEIAHVFDDNGISGAKGRQHRKEFDKLLKGAVRREFDMVAAWSVDRLGRSLQDLIGFLQELHGAGVDLYLHQQALDTSTPSGKAMFQMMGVFAEFERSMISERVKSGLARAKSNGKTLGRPKVSPDIEAQIHDLREQGMGILRIGKELGVGTSTVQRVVSGYQMDITTMYRSRFRFAKPPPPRLCHHRHRKKSQTY